MLSVTIATLMRLAQKTFAQLYEQVVSVRVSTATIRGDSIWNKEIYQLYYQVMKSRSSPLTLAAHDDILVRNISIIAFKREQSENGAQVRVGMEEIGCSFAREMNQRVAYNEVEEEMVDEGHEAKVDLLTADGGADLVFKGENNNNNNNNNGFGEYSPPALKCPRNCKDPPQVAAHSASVSSTSSYSSCSLTSSSCQIYIELGNKCGKCQNHEIEVSKKGE